ncbi:MULTISPECIES: glycosyltransferase family 2 protein [unclassified Sulfurospirillum]|uniref:glycosyltransferase family 2 protein n=1 Tax=unclassified Sulfurospirillum TaxID=2618290 RepID=UPI000507D26C|nr:MULTISPECIES: glycosyltransferase family 2 protein [unclassified Sulfurospirillum]KFL34044.1 glycosyl transferase family 2 [Sulfurospirillum sp. SCADC]
MVQINASIVLYHNDKIQLLKAIESFLNTSLHVKLYLIDNSSDDNLKELKNIDERIEYIFNNANVGYGAGHNIAMQQSIKDCVSYHIVLNPDIYFQKGVLEGLYEYMQENKEVGHVMPKVVYPNGELQKLCKLLPTPLDLFARRFIPLKSVIQKINYRYELEFFNYEEIAEIPFLSGCFMFFRTDILKQNCLFDDDFFMYLEDADLTRRIARLSKTIYYPKVTITHEYQRGAHKSKKLLWIFIKSVFIYFKKYGWAIDKEREIMNEKTLKVLGYYKK